jgi:RNA polymerase sigma factor (sigma-70 family)
MSAALMYPDVAAQAESDPDPAATVATEPVNPVAIPAALNADDSVTARGVVAVALEQDPGVAEEWKRGTEIDAWPDAWLIASVRQDPPDALALDELVQRHWKTLFARCLMVTLGREEASDLAQETWSRVLRSRSQLRPDGNFPAYLNMIALNLWRDRCRAQRRAGEMAASRLASLDAEVTDAEGNGTSLADIIPDLNALEGEQQARLMLDIDEALERLTPILRGVLVARFLEGESCAEIGRRHGRTEQTISGWLRRAVQEMRAHLTECRSTLQPPEPP